ncbi:MAG: hypothetical protein IKV38_03810, partial [Clostridia bacterium]|nr:hypothetical protein [Clostridia bacterium]
LVIGGFLSATAVFGAMIRDCTPEGKAGMFQGLRIVGQVLIPGIIGPMIGARVLKNAEKIINDDGTTSFADMDLTRPLHQQKHSKKVEFDLSKKEIRAIRRAMFLRYLPPIICGICGFTIAMLIITLWLS